MKFSGQVMLLDGQRMQSRLTIRTGAVKSERGKTEDEIRTPDLQVTRIIGHSESMITLTR